MEVKIEMKPTSAIIANLGIQENGPAHKFFTNTCYKYMGPFVPGGVNSHINQNVFIEADSITYLSPSSHYQYIGKRYVDPKYGKGAFFSPDYGFWSRPGITKIPTNIPLKYHTPGTGGYWDKRMITSKDDQVVKEVQDFVDKRCKND